MSTGREDGCGVRPVARSPWTEGRSARRARKALARGRPSFPPRSSGSSGSAGVSFEWRDGFQPGTRTRTRGVIAQEVQAVFPDAVTEDESGYLMVDYNGLVAALIEAVKELAARVEELESRRGETGAAA